MQLTKHHGLGNDFLVALVDTLPDDAAAFARRVCDRRRGIGADGLMFGLPAASDARADVDVVMVLFNADGSRPEMSGNGIRCLAQAVAMRDGLANGDINITTDGGQRIVSVAPGSNDGEIMARVNMGPVGPGPGVDPSLALDQAATADLGNPHLVVLVDDPSAVDVGTDGPALEQVYPDGMNVEFIAKAPNATDTIDLVVWERGVGITEACGTGACAAATLAHTWGLVGNEVTVQMPGGIVVVDVADTVFLNGPAEYIATIEVAHG